MYKSHSFEERLEAVRLVKKGLTFRAVSRSLGVETHQIIEWSKNYDLYGTVGLLSKKNREKSVKKAGTACSNRKKTVPLSPNSTTTSHPSTPMGRKKKREPESELDQLRAENEYLRTELALLKKVQALMAEKEARLLEIGQKPSNH